MELSSINISLVAHEHNVLAAAKAAALETNDSVDESDSISEHSLSEVL
jgi:hypothetical protein